MKYIMAINAVISFSRPKTTSSITNGAKITKFWTALPCAALDLWAQSEYSCAAASGYKKAFIGPDLINEFKNITNCPVLVNTSFNVRGEPIVCSIADAFNCFMGTELDVLAIGDYLLFKSEQDEALKENYENRYELD